jgi:hypothetical protein
MKTRTKKPFVWIMTIVFLVLAACSSGTPEPTDLPTETEPAEPQKTEEVEPSPVGYAYRGDIVWCNFKLG